MKKIKSILFLLIAITFVSSISFAQSPFKSLHKQSAKKYGVSQTVTPTTVTAFRFTAPFAGYTYPQQQIVTGIGYGWQKLHWVEETQKYYTDFSISGVVYAGGNVTPSIQDRNIISIGVSLGVLNQLIMFGPVYNFPKGDSKGSFGLVVNFGIPLNN